MIISVTMDLKNLIELGKNYPWDVPGPCPGCGGELWSHGFVKRYFEEIQKPVFLKRYKCVKCGSIHTLRPDDHFPGMLASKADMLCSMLKKSNLNRWEKNFSHQRQLHWFRRFSKEFKDA
ncbi:MAG: DUF6431 domain-containing protein [Candidatus Wallbacteria bacterium]|nr:DUF6431 domain-containing protein [Candidatus Wallbacteria bacterium]